MSTQPSVNKKTVTIAKFQKVAIDPKQQKAVKGGSDWIIIEEIIAG